MSLAAGVRLGPYEIRAPLGAGGMGEVYRARDTRLGREVALKILRGPLRPGASALRRFELEARSAGMLNHPNIVSVYDVGTHDGTPYIVSELLEGETLKARLAHGPLPLRKTLDYATQIAAGLAGARAKGLVHRDLKPSNVFVTTDGRVKILDFGLVKLLDPEELAGAASGEETASESNRPGALVGTVNYMSPEQVRGDPADHRTDIFSFGLVLYEMLSRRRAFDRGSAVGTMNAILNEEPPEGFDLPPDLAPLLPLIVRRCLEKNPDERFQSASDLGFALRSLGTLPSVRRTGAPRLAPAWRRWAVAAIAVVALVGSPAFFLGRRTADPPLPALQQLTFRRGSLQSARFAPDGHTIVYSAAWDGEPLRIYSVRSENPESRFLGLPDGDLLSLSSTGEMAISLGGLPWRLRASAATLGTLARLPLGGSAPREMLADVAEADWAPDGRSLAVVRRENGRYRLEYPIRSVLYESGGWISHPRVSPDGQIVAFIDHPVSGDDRGSLCLVGSDRRMVVISADWVSANGLAWSPSGSEVWFTAADVGMNSALYAADLERRVRLVARWPARLRLQDVHRDGRVLLGVNQLRLLMKARAVGDAAERDLSWFDASVVTDLSADGRFVLFEEEGIGSGAAHYAIYLRPTDGSPAVRLGEGMNAALSADGARAAAVVLGPPPHLALWPTGPGEPTLLDRGPVSAYESVAWFPDGRRLLFTGSEPGGPVRLYVQDVPAGTPRPLSDEGLKFPYYSRPVSPDGRLAAVTAADDRLVIVPIDDGPPRPVAGSEPGDVPLRWSAGGDTLYVLREDSGPRGSIFRVDPRRPAWDPVTRIGLQDPAGVHGITSAQITPDGRFLVYSYAQSLSNLYVVQGLE